MKSRLNLSRMKGDEIKGSVAVVRRAEGNEAYQRSEDGRRLGRGSSGLSVWWQEERVWAGSVRLGVKCMISL